MLKQITTSEIVGEQQQESRKDRREGKGRVLAISRRIYRLQRTDVFYVESESSDGVYYFVKFKPDVFEWCSCKDNSTKGLKCKHLFAIEFAIRWGTLRDTDKLPAEAKRYGSTISTTATDVKPDTTLMKAISAATNEELGNHFLVAKSIKQTSRIFSLREAEVAIQQKKSKSYKDGDYSF